MLLPYQVYCQFVLAHVEFIPSGANVALAASETIGFAKVLAKELATAF
jgi:hypothetical protein